MHNRNYIKAYRRRWHLSQKELGFLLGRDSATKICRIERGQCEPEKHEVAKLELLFQTASSRLFPDLHKRHAKQLLHRLSLFEQMLTEGPATRENMFKLSEIRKVRQEIARINADLA